MNRDVRIPLLLLSDLIVVVAIFAVVLAVRPFYAPPQPTRLYCPPDSCVMIRMRDGSTCRVWRAPYGSAKPVRWSCP